MNTILLDGLHVGLSLFELRDRRLYTATGGCAVGVMLRALFPTDCDRYWLPWQRRRWIRSIEQDQRPLSRRHPPLWLLEDQYDRMVEATRQADRSLTRGQACELVGQWLRREVREELLRRARSGQAPVLAPPSRFERLLAIGAV